MIIQENLTIQEKLKILTDAAKYDVACTSSGVQRRGKVKKMREQIEDLAVVCYINSTAELKAVSDVCPLDI